jgi:hypothetical protein
MRLADLVVNVAPCRSLRRNDCFGTRWPTSYAGAFSSNSARHFDGLVFIDLEPRSCEYRGFGGCWGSIVMVLCDSDIIMEKEG